MNATSIALTCLIALSAPHQFLGAADGPRRTPTGPAQAVMPVVQAARGNDVVALWKLVASSSGAETILGRADVPGPGRMIRERIDDLLAAVLAADAQADLVARWLNWSGGVLGTATATARADLPPPGPGGPGGGPGAPDWTMVAGRILASALAQGLETQQIAAGKRLLAAAHAWASTIDIADAGHARSAVAALIAAVTDLGVATVADVEKKEQGDLLARGGHALAHLKAAALAYGLDLDAVLDSLRIIDIMDIQPGDGAKAVTIAFSAFGSEQRFPFKMQRGASGSWTVIADSPLDALLGDRQGAIDVMFEMMGPPPGPPGGPGGPGGRRADRAPPPAIAPPAPGNDGF